MSEAESARSMISRRLVPAGGWLPKKTASPRLGVGDKGSPFRIRGKELSSSAEQEASGKPSLKFGITGMRSLITGWWRSEERELP
jgi:hypothetical protein